MRARPALCYPAGRFSSAPPAGPIKNSTNAPVSAGNTPVRISLSWLTSTFGPVAQLSRHPVSHTRSSLRAGDAAIASRSRLHVSGLPRSEHDGP